MLTLLASLSLASCGGGGAGGDSATGGTGGGGGGGTSNFTVTYTDTSDILSLDFFNNWYAENADGSLRGPYDSGGDGVVDLGQESRTGANVTLDMAGTFYSTYMDMPVGNNTYNTDNRLGGGTVRATLTNVVPGDEAHIAYFIDNFFTITGTPHILAQSVTLYDIVGTDGMANVFVNYRSSSLEEPLSRYDFKIDFPSTDVGNVSMDLGGFKTRVPKSWTSTNDLTTDKPFVMAQRKGVVFSPIGNSDADPGGMSGTFGFPDQFPADRWYLASGGISVIPEIVTEFNISDNTVSLLPLGRVIDGPSMAVDVLNGTFTATITGSDRIDYAHLLLTVGGSLSWDIYFPWSVVQMTGDTATLHLPSLPGYSTLPAFDFMKLEIYRFDAATTVNSMLRYILDSKRNPYPSYAMKVEW
jgi:hypothetical protein